MCHFLKKYADYTTLSEVYPLFSLGKLHSWPTVPESPDSSGCLTCVVEGPRKLLHCPRITLIMPKIVLEFLPIMATPMHTYR